MKITRDTVRLVVPPLLALGLVAVVTHPADAVPASSPQPVAAVSVGR
ncbi:MAG: hypothetical protein AB7O74_02710 [Candidatus Nanopelagicales bacterium]